eukprot:scaffold229290_cov28-Tisochrysis_lutea.AAC.7
MEVNQAATAASTVGLKCIGRAVRRSGCAVTCRRVETVSAKGANSRSKSTKLRCGGEGGIEMSAREDVRSEREGARLSIHTSLWSRCVDGKEAQDVIKHAS